MEEHVRAGRSELVSAPFVAPCAYSEPVRIVTIGKGNVGGGLADFWRKAGHEVTELGREGGDATGADAALLAVPAAAISDALRKIRGLEGVPVIDSTNVIRDPRPDGFESLAGYVKSLTGGPVAKAFQLRRPVRQGC
jgi:8-hydroxy-5-deazaflavin:NADPH oxidoreductase